MKMYSILLPLLLASGSAMYAMHFPVYEDPMFYNSLVMHVNGLLKPLPDQIKQAQQQLQDLLAGNSNQAAISRAIDTLVGLYIQELQMNATLAYVDRARQFIRICQKKFDDQKAESQAVKDQEPLRALMGIESLLPEQVMTKKNSVAAAQEEEESAEPNMAQEVSEDEEKSEEENKQEVEEQFEKNAESKGKAGALKDAAMYQQRLKGVEQELKEGPKNGQSTATWRAYIMKKYQDAKDWYFGTEGKDTQADEK